MVQYRNKVHVRSTRPDKSWSKGTGANAGLWVKTVYSKMRPVPKKAIRDQISAWREACGEIYDSGRYKSYVPRKGTAQYRAVKKLEREIKRE